MSNLQILGHREHRSRDLRSLGSVCSPLGCAAWIRNPSHGPGMDALVTTHQIGQVYSMGSDVKVQTTMYLSASSSRRSSQSILR